MHVEHCDRDQARILARAVSRSDNARVELNLAEPNARRSFGQYDKIGGFCIIYERLQLTHWVYWTM